MSRPQTRQTQKKRHPFEISETSYFTTTEESEMDYNGKDSGESSSDTEAVYENSRSRSRSVSRAPNSRSREEQPEKRIRSSSRTGSSRREEEATKMFRSSSRSGSSRGEEEATKMFRSSSRSGSSRREEQPTKLSRSSSRNRSKPPHPSHEVTYGQQEHLNRQRKRSGSSKTNAEDAVVLPLSRQRSHGGSMNKNGHYLALEIQKIRGMSTIPTSRPYFKDLKIRIYVTWMDETVQSPQIARAGSFDPDDLVFKWPVSSQMAQIAMDEFKLKLVLKLERDEEKGKSKWTHVVGKATITKGSGKHVRKGIFRVDLAAEIPDHGLQQLEYSVNLF